MFKAKVIHSCTNFTKGQIIWIERFGEHDAITCVSEKGKIREGAPIPIGKYQILSHFSPATLRGSIREHEELGKALSTSIRFSPIVTKVLREIDDCKVFDCPFYDKTAPTAVSSSSGSTSIKNYFLYTDYKTEEVFIRLFIDIEEIDNWDEESDAGSVYQHSDLGIAPTTTESIDLLVPIDLFTETIDENEYQEWRSEMYKKTVLNKKVEAKRHLEDIYRRYPELKEKE